jgi:hypothetical protein
MANATVEGILVPKMPGAGVGETEGVVCVGSILILFDLKDKEMAVRIKKIISPK